MTPDRESLQCLRKKYHTGDHLVQLNESRGQRFIGWGPDEECDCEDCERGDHCESFLYEEISKAEAEKLIGN